MESSDIVIIDYGMGNLWSVQSAFEYLGCRPLVTGDPARVARADTLILPGVGSFRKAMHTLRDTGLADAILEAVNARQRKILGICLGMQLLGSKGSEDGVTPGLNLVPNPVDAFDVSETGSNKIPHIGFNLVRSEPNARLFDGLPDAADFYFVHSYRMLPDGLNATMATCVYGVEFLAAFEQDNIYGTQFHPEKSQTNGLTLLRNFLAQ